MLTVCSFSPNFTFLCNWGKKYLSYCDCSHLLHQRWRLSSWLRLIYVILCWLVRLCYVMLCYGMLG